MLILLELVENEIVQECYVNKNHIIGLDKSEKTGGGWLYYIVTSSFNRSITKECYERIIEVFQSAHSDYIGQKVGIEYLYSKKEK